MTIGSTAPTVWNRTSVGEVIRGLYDGPHATPKPASEGPVFLGIKNITDDGRLDLSEIRHVSEEDFPKWTKRVLPQPGDIVFTYEATLNRYAIIPEGFRGCLGRRLALIRPNSEEVDTRFLFYYFFGEDWRSLISKNTLSGSTVDRISLTRFPSFELKLPPLPTQRKIASVLSAYDDLIENNTRRIEVLEEMAQALYREWFVNFRFPGHEKVGMVDSELGPIPGGWKVEPFSSFADLARLGINPGKFGDEEFNHFSIPAFDESRMPRKERGSTIKSNKYLLPEGCVLLSKINPRIPRVWLPFIDTEDRAITSTEFLVLTPKDQVASVFLYSVCRSDEFLQAFAAQSLGTSTSHQRVKPEDLLRMRVVTPPYSLIEAYSTVAKAMTRLTHMLRRKNVNLRRTRNLLLPKLISGEVGVDELKSDTSTLGCLDSPR